MSGVYFKGMQMPTKQTTVTIFPNGYVAIYDARDSFIGETRAVAVPEHGDLIDRQALEAKMKTRSWYVGRASDPDCLVADAPTVIPTDKEEP